MDLGLTYAKVTYISNFINDELQNKILTKYQDIFIEEKNKCVIADDRTYKLNRKTLVLIDEELENYVIPKIWGEEVTVLKFDDEIKCVKEDLEKLLEYSFNICLCNYYLNGKSNISFHSDNEEKGDIECIASVSIGEKREFGFRKKNCDEKKIIKKIELESGSLLIMDKGCQENYEHSLLANKNLKNPRLNITFRNFKFDTYSNK